MHTRFRQSQLRQGGALRYVPGGTGVLTQASLAYPCPDLGVIHSVSQALLLPLAEFPPDEHSIEDPEDIPLRRAELVGGLVPVILSCPDGRHDQVARCYRRGAVSHQ